MTKKEYKEFLKRLGKIEKFQGELLPTDIILLVPIDD